MNLNKILMVDDEQAHLFLNEHYLRICNVICEIEMACDGADALQKIEQSEVKPDMILLDMHMRGMGGLAFLSAFAQTACSKHTKVFVISSSENTDEINTATGYPFVNGFIQKPLNKHLVQQMLMHFE